MADNTNKVTIDAEPITIPAAQFSRILAAAVHCEYLMKQKHINEEKICRMRAELTRYQTICENRKRTSGAGASAEPQQTTTDADETKTDAGALAIEAEGRVSGGERAELESLRKERDELKAKLDDAKAHYCTNATGRLGDSCKVAALCRENEAELAAAERCIDEIEGNIICTTSWENKLKIIEDAIRAYREKKEAK